MGTHSSREPSRELAGLSVAELARNPDKCIEMIRPHTSALDASTLTNYFSDPMATAAQVLSLITRLQSLEGAMREHTPTFDRSRIELLAPAAVALAQLQGRSLSASAQGAVEASEMLDRAAKTRASLQLSASFLVSKELASAAAVERLQRIGNGYTDTSAAILGLVEMHFDEHGRLIDRSPATREELDAARQQAIELAALGQGRNVRGEDDVALAEEKRRTYQFVVGTYNKIRSVVQYLRYEFEDADDYAPPLGNKPNARRSAKSEAPEDPAPAHPSAPAEPSAPVAPSRENPLEE